VTTALLAESFDKHGKMLRHETKIIELQSTSQPDGVKLHLDISTSSPAARLRFVVRMNSIGKLGADNYFLTDKKTPSDPSIGLRLKSVEKN
jgi:hypothetical protein